MGNLPLIWGKCTWNKGKCYYFSGEIGEILVKSRELPGDKVEIRTEKRKCIFNWRIQWNIRKYWEITGNKPWKRKSQWNIKKLLENCIYQEISPHISVKSHYSKEITRKLQVKLANHQLLGQITLIFGHKAREITIILGNCPQILVKTQGDMGEITWKLKNHWERGPTFM